MISTADFRNGLIIIMGAAEALMEIVEFQHVKPGKGGAFVRTKLKNILTGKVLEKTFRSGEKMEEARVTTEKYEYLYTDGDLYHFMEQKNYEQIAVSSELVGDRKNWLKENGTYGLMFYNGRVIDIELPMTIIMLITKCDPGIQGDRSTGGIPMSALLLPTS